MRIAVLRETAPGEARVALVPDVVQRLAKAGHQISIQRGAGLAAGFTDADYEKAGARVLESRAEALTGAELWARVRSPTPAEIGEAPEGVTLVSMLGVEPVDSLLPALAARRLTLLGARARAAHHARPVDGRALVAEHRRRLQGGADRRGRAARSSSRCSPPRPATLAPAKVFVHRRRRRRAPGHRHRAAARGVVAGFDVRPAAREQVLSLGATFVGPERVRRLRGRRAATRGRRPPRSRRRRARRWPRPFPRAGSRRSPRRRSPAGRRRSSSTRMVARHAPGLGDRGPGRGDRAATASSRSPARRVRRGRRDDHRAGATRRPRCRSTRARCSAATCSRSCSTSPQGGRAQARPRGRDHRGDARHAERAGRREGRDA